jgi:hypothetical protein
MKLFVATRAIVCTLFFLTTFSTHADVNSSSSNQPVPKIGGATGPDTSLPAEKIGTQGNWLKKREWLMKSHEAFAEIQNLVTQIEQSRLAFVTKLNDTDKLLDTYYTGLGLADGKINELLENIGEHLEKKRKKDLAGIGVTGEKHDPDLQAKIDIIESNIKHNTLQLEQLRLDMKAIEDLGKSLVERVKRVDERLASIQTEFTNAQNIINDLWDIIDHNKAREKYYELKITILEKIKSEQAYLQQDLLSDFDTVIQTIVTQIGRTEEEIKKIEANGLFIKNRAQRVKELKLKEAAATAKSAISETTAAERKAVIETKNVIVEHSLWERMYSGMVSVIAWLSNTIQWFKVLIFGGATVQQAPLLKPANLPPAIPTQPVAIATTTDAPKAAISSAPTIPAS